MGEPHKQTHKRAGNSRERRPQQAFTASESRLKPSTNPTNTSQNAGGRPQTNQKGAGDGVNRHAQQASTSANPQWGLAINLIGLSQNAGIGEPHKQTQLRAGNSLITHPTQAFTPAKPQWGLATNPTGTLENAGMRERAKETKKARAMAITPRYRWYLVPLKRGGEQRQTQEGLQKTQG